MSLVGKQAPSFKAAAVINGNKIIQNFTLEDYLGKQEVLFFFYPKDFTFVCPTELIAFQEYLAEFENKGVAIVGCSTDSEECHLNWLNTPIDKGGIKGITYPLVADTSKIISHNYGVLAGNWDYDENDQLIFDGQPIAYRGTFLIDKEGIVRHETVNDLPIGRNIEEMLRVIDMWHHTKEYGEVCPANWYKGKKALKATPEGIIGYLSNYLEENAYEFMINNSGCCGGSSNCSNNNCGCSRDDEQEEETYNNTGCCNSHN